VFPVLLPLIGGLVCFPVVLEAPDSGDRGHALADTAHLAADHVPEDPGAGAAVLAGAASVVLLVATIVAVLWLSARIYAWAS